MLLNKAGIAASSGSACTSGSLEPSHVMRAMDIPYTAAHGTIRFSFSRYNSMSEVDEVLKVMPGIVAKLRKLSPYWEGDGPVADPEKAFAPTYA
jgi:cysteine desulfurase